MSARKSWFGTVLKTLILLVLVAVIGFGAWLGVSAKRVSELLGQAQTSYAAVQAGIEQEDYDAAIASAREAASTAALISSELEGTQWELAGHLPVLGTDVAAARTVGAVSSKLANEGVVPVLDAWEALSDTSTVSADETDPTGLTQKVGQLGNLVHSLEAANTVVGECSSQMQGVPTSHFDQINSYAETLNGVIAQADESLGQLEGALSLYSGLESLVSGLMG